MAPGSEATPDADESGLAKAPGKPVLFVGHEASTTGAPFVLLHFLEWLRRHTTIDFEIALLDGGPLVERFARLGRTLILQRSAMPRSGGAGAGGNSGGHGGGEVYHWPADTATRYGLIYAGSLVSAAALRWCPGITAPIVTHVHELDSEIVPRRKALRLGTTRYVAAAACVRDALVDRFGVPADLVVTSHEFVPVDRVVANAARADRAALRRRLGLPDGACVVGMVGQPAARKGPDLFLDLAAILHKTMPEDGIRLVWLGGSMESQTFRELTGAVHERGLDDLVRVLPDTLDPWPIVDQFDLFALTSREDPFPLVMLEAAALARPIVAFDAGGAREFIRGDDLEDECGIVVPGLDVEAMATAVRCLLAAPDRRFRYGMAARRKVRERHDVSVGAAALHRALADLWPA